MGYSSSIAQSWSRDRPRSDIITSRKFNSRRVPALPFVFPNAGDAGRLLGLVAASTRDEKSVGEYAGYHKGEGGAELVERNLT